MPRVSGWNVRPPLLVLALIIVFPVLLPAQVARNESARLERLAQGVYAIIHDDATDAWPHGNTGVVVGADGVL